MNDYLVVVIAPDREPERYLLTAAGWKENANNNAWSYVTVNKEGEPERDNGLTDDCIFILINQYQYEETITKLLKRVNCLRKKIIVLSHRTQKNQFIVFDLIKIYQTINCKPFHFSLFSHPPEMPDKAVLDFMESFSSSNKDWDYRKGILQDYIDKIVKKKSKSDAHTLRADILTPFIPFHLYNDPDNQKSGEWDTILDECCKAINAIDDEDKSKNIIEEKFNKLIGLKSNFPNATKESAQNMFNALKTNFITNEGNCLDKVKEMDCRMTIEEFAKNLEGIVNSIEEDKSQ